MTTTGPAELDAQIPPRFRLPDALWDRIGSILPVYPRRYFGGLPRQPDRPIMEAILFVLLTGIPWRALPRCYGAATTAHDRFQEWTQAGVFEELWRQALLEYDQEVGLQ